MREEHDRERELVAARLAGSIAHMVGTPLQVIAGRAALARRTASLDEALSHIQIIERKCREVSSDLQRTVDLLRHLQGVATKCDVAELFTDIVHELRQEYPASELELELPDDPMRPATLHAGELRLATKGLVRALATSTNTSRLTLQIREIEQERSRRMLSITLTTEASLRIESSSSLSEPWRQKSRTLLRSADLALPLVYEVSRLHGGDLRIVDQSLVMTWALDSVP